MVVETLKLILIHFCPLLLILSAHCILEVLLPLLGSLRMASPLIPPCRRLYRLLPKSCHKRPCARCQLTSQLSNRDWKNSSRRIPMCSLGSMLDWRMSGLVDPPESIHSPVSLVRISTSAISLMWYLIMLLFLYV
jgi:hypothetical protein